MFEFRVKPGFGHVFLSNSRKAIVACSLAAVSMVVTATASSAADPRELNRGRIGLLTGASTDTSLNVGADMARILDGKSNLRIVPYLSSGSIDNIDDLMNYRFADMALINSDALLSRKLRDPNDERLSRINYVARLFTNEVHIITRGDSGVDSIIDLQGRRFAAGEARSGSFLTASLLMRASGVRATAIAMPTEDGLIALEDGTVDAVFFLAAKPSAFLRKLTSDANFALVRVPISDNIRAVYKPSEFSSEDYPGLVRDKFVETVSVDVILAAYGNPPVGSEKYKKFTAFVTELQRNQSQFKRPPSHRKWQEFSLEEDVDGIERNGAAVAALSGQETEQAARPSIFDLMKEGVDQQ